MGSAAARRAKLKDTAGDSDLNFAVSAIFLGGYMILCMVRCLI